MIYIYGYILIIFLTYVTLFFRLRYLTKIRDTTDLSNKTKIKALNNKIEKIKDFIFLKWK